MYERLLSILRPGSSEEPPANLEQVLQALPGELLSNFTFVYASRSPHRTDIDPLFPRVVLFSTDGKLLVAFTGNPRAVSYDQLDVIYFDDRRSAFHASRFILPDAVRGNRLLEHDAALNGRTDQFECTRCHGGDVRPIFDSYSLWPGFYGSRADMVDGTSHEGRDYARFLAQTARQGVYRYLRFPSGSPTPPYQDGSAPLDPGEALRFHPNERLGDALTPLNWRRIVRKLSSRGDPYRRLRYPLLAGLLGCSALPISQAFDLSIESSLEAENTRRFERANHLGVGADAWRFRMQELAQGIPRGVSEIAYVAKALGVSRADWSMSFEPSALGFFDGVLTRPVRYVKEDLLTAMLGELSSTDPAFGRYYSPRFVFQPYGYDIGLKLDMAKDYANPQLCALLAERTRAVGAPMLETVEQIDNSEGADLPAASPALAALAKRCAICHEGNAAFAGLEIPFTNPVALRRKLRFERSLRTGKPLLDEMLRRISPHADDPMPPSSSGPPLSGSERRDLAGYLRDLGGTRHVVGPSRLAPVRAASRFN